MSVETVLEANVQFAEAKSAEVIGFNRRRDRIKILGRGGNSFWLFLKPVEADDCLSERRTLIVVSSR